MAALLTFPARHLLFDRGASRRLGQSEPWKGAVQNSPRVHLDVPRGARRRHYWPADCLPGELPLRGFANALDGRRGVSYLEGTPRIA